MAKPNFGFQKHQKEQARERKKQEKERAKELRKMERAKAAGDEAAGAQADGDAAAPPAE